MDANPGAVQQTLSASGCRIMIHGHTHRPSHEIVNAATGSERWVLSDWDVGRGDALEITAGKIRRLDWSN
jgi:UDP-2,3-diacylglucosamine pyrophosphatase LpxH